MTENKALDVKKLAKSFLYLALTLYLIMSFVISAYRIPTGSMERTLRVGDMLLVNKFIYGFRTPDWFGIPFTEKGFDIPWVKTPLFKQVRQGDVVVFKHFDPGMNQWLYYVKRCVALPGQTVQVIDKELYVDGKLFAEFYNTVEIDSGTEDLKAKERFIDPLIYQNEYPEKVLSGNEFLKIIRSTPKLSSNFLILGTMTENCIYPKEFLAVDKVACPGDTIRILDGFAYVNGTKIDSVRSELIIDNFDKVFFSTRERYADGNGYNFLNNLSFILSSINSKDNFGPIKVPEDSYFMMGDNRDLSSDSRYWGFVEEDLIVGKPIMVYFSFDYNKDFKIYEFWKNDFTIRWERTGYFIQ